MEWLTCTGWSWLARETLTFARLLSVLAWVAGAIPVYVMARQITSMQSAILALAVYLFAPYGIEASRAFQPDSLMTCCALWATLALVRQHERETTPRILTSAAAIAVATLVKPMSVFLTVPAVFALAAAQHGFVASLGRVATWLPLVLGLLPAAGYYGYSALFGTLARDQMRLRFVPSLLITPFFWGGMTTQVLRVFGPVLITLAAAGTLLAPTRQARALLAGWWLGYAAFAVAFTYHMPTHDYYHLPFLGLAALSLAALAERLRRWSGASDHAVLALIAAAALTVVVWGTTSVWPRLHVAGLDRRVADYQAIGALADHTAKAIFLDAEYGYALMYHGEVSGDAWPSTDDLTAERLGGASPIAADARFARDFDYGATHFIVTDLASLAAQPDLVALLAARATVVRATDRYQVHRFTSD